MSGVKPWSSARSVRAPWASSSFTTSRAPCALAWSSGVQPLWSREFTAAPFERNRSTSSSEPTSAAIESGVAPSPAVHSSAAPPSSAARAASTFPSRVAAIRRASIAATLPADEAADGCTGALPASGPTVAPVAAASSSADARSCRMGSLLQSASLTPPAHQGERRDPEQEGERRLWHRDGHDVGDQDQEVIELTVVRIAEAGLPGDQELAGQEQAGGEAGQLDHGVPVALEHHRVWEAGGVERVLDVEELLHALVPLALVPLVALVLVPAPGPLGPAPLVPLVVPTAVVAILVLALVVVVLALVVLAALQRGLHEEPERAVEGRAAGVDRAVDGDRLVGVEDHRRDVRGRDSAGEEEGVVADVVRVVHAERDRLGLRRLVDDHLRGHRPRRVGPELDVQRRARVDPRAGDDQAVEDLLQGLRLGSRLRGVVALD